MKRISLLMVAITVIGACLSLTAADRPKKEKEKKFGDARFIAYEGDQKWPTADKAEVIKDYAVPIYVGLPNKKYEVLGRIHDPRTSGIGIVTRGIAHAFSEKDRQRNVTDLAKDRGAEAVVVTRDEAVLKIFDISDDKLEDTAPLFDHKDKIVLAVKFK